MSAGVRVRVWGDFALFSRPEFKAERVTYDVMTPSAARGILECIHWKPAIRWVVDRIHVLKPVQLDTVRRNEVGKKLPYQTARQAAQGNESELVLFIDDERQQRASLLLRNVEYVIDAHFEMTPAAGPEDNPGKHTDMARRRIARGQCVQQPCFRLPRISRLLRASFTRFQICASTGTGRPAPSRMDAARHRLRA
jgi:CRISPR-associated protein Cas5d